MIIQCDSRERKFDHVTSHFDSVGVKWFVSKLVVADYMNLDYPRLVIDRKQNLDELTNNLTTQHERFRNELIRGLDLGLTIIFLCEHSRSIRTLSDVRHWVNPRLKISPLTLSGMELYKRLNTIEAKYHTRFLFCEKQNTGSEIIRLLSQNIPEYGIERR